MEEEPGLDHHIVAPTEVDIVPLGEAYSFRDTTGLQPAGRLKLAQGRTTDELLPVVDCCADSCTISVPR